MEEYTNHLINESSPYLLQHAHNPVEWYPWSDEALNLAQKEQKLLIVSIGYAACHWCHVMEHESFEDSVVAQLMNDRFVSIKVDREERPDIDQVYMDAAHLMTGKGGWPLNIIALPDGRPIYAGTYFTKAQWLKVLEGVDDFYRKTPEKALEQAMQVAAGVKQMNFVPAINKTEFNLSELNEAAGNWLNALDIREGGRAGQMKFPMAGSYLELLRYGINFDNSRAIELVQLTLDKMAAGGLYDQLGGGFSRYSVDPYWNVPHFEKMLYDNAQLLELYSEAFKYTKDPYYAQIVRETIEFLDRELLSPEGAYYSSLDADSDGEEGKYYVWTSEEVDNILGTKAEIFKDFYKVTKQGNWHDGKNVLRMSVPIERLQDKYSLTSEEIADILNSCRKLLLEVRHERIMPALDDKILTSWNGLMLNGLASSYEALGIEDYRSRAIALGNFLWDKMWTGERLFRNYKEGKSTINGFIDDYAFMISGFISLYRISFDKEWLDRAELLTKKANSQYYDDGTGLYQFKSSEDKELFVAKAVLEDNVIPSGNAEMANNLFKLGNLLGNRAYIEQSKRMLRIASANTLEHAAFYYNWFGLYQEQLTPLTEVVILGEDCDHVRKEMVANYLKTSLILGDKYDSGLASFKDRYIEGKTNIYVCKDRTCMLPTTDIATALEQL